MNYSVKTKIWVTFIGLALALLAHSTLLDQAGIRHTEQGLNRALVTYGISRGLNGVISVVQGTEVAVEPVGIGMTFTPGQILDPVNDLIERFSTVVLFSGTAFGIQRLMLDILATPAFSIGVSLLLLLALAVIWFGKSWNSAIQATVQPLLYKAVIILLIVRFCIPVLAIMSENFYQVFLAPQYETSSQQLIATTDQLNDIRSESEPKATTDGAETSFLESARELYRSATNTFDMQRHLNDFKAAAENISEHAINLIVVFLFQTILLPLGSIWLILKTIRWVAAKKL